MIWPDGTLRYLSARGGFSGFASFGIPIVNEMNGLQSKTGYRLFTGIAYAF